MDGSEVLDRLSRERTLPTIPIIVISGQPAPEEIAADPRIRCWLTKPVSIDELVAQIQQPLEGVASGVR
jgi:CheY-like chemotaxis protein